MRKTIAVIFIVSIITTGCATQDLSVISQDPPVANNLHNTVSEEPKLAFESTTEIIYVDRPIFVPKDETPIKEIPLQGTLAVSQSMEDGLVLPQDFKNSVMIYPYDETKVFEVYTKVDDVTDIILEPGEMAVSQPYLSNTDEWIQGGAVSKTNGIDTQHLYLQPKRVGLNQTYIIVTDRRVYHLKVKSYAQIYMPIVKWNYFNSMPQNFINKSGGTGNNNGVLNVETGTKLDYLDPRFLSNNYKVTWNIFTNGFKGPSWVPEYVCDDGEKTYIVFPKNILQKTFPAVFGEKENLVTYRIVENVVVVDKLVEYLVVKYENKKIKIIKKKG